MAISDKLRALLALTGKKSSDLALYYGISPQAMRNKFSRGSFSADDLIKISEFLGAELSFHISDQVITLDTKDLQGHGNIGTPVPSMEEVAKTDDGRLVSECGETWDKGLIKLNESLGGGFELVPVKTKRTKTGK